jgi:hypothetical protein
MLKWHSLKIEAQLVKNKAYSKTHMKINLRKTSRVPLISF